MFARTASSSSSAKHGVVTQQQQQQQPQQPPPPPSQQGTFSPGFGGQATAGTEHPFGDMVIDSQEVDMSVLGAEMMPWDLEYLPHEMMFFGDGSFGMGIGGDEG